MRDPTRARLLVIVVSLALPAAAPPASAGPNDETIELSRRAMAQVKEVVAEIQADLDAAREAKDTIRANCLDVRLAQAKKLFASGMQAGAELEFAAGNRQADAVARAYAVVEAVAVRVDRVQQDARECVGANAYEGKTQVEATEGSTAEVKPPEQTLPVTRPVPTSPTD